MKVFFFEPGKKEKMTLRSLWRATQPSRLPVAPHAALTHRHACLRFLPRLQRHRAARVLRLCRCLVGCDSRALGRQVRASLLLLPLPPRRSVPPLFTTHSPLALLAAALIYATVRSGKGSVFNAYVAMQVGVVGAHRHAAPNGTAARLRLSGLASSRHIARLPTPHLHWLHTSPAPRMLRCRCSSSKPPTSRRPACT